VTETDEQVKASPTAGDRASRADPGAAFDLSSSLVTLSDPAGIESESIGALRSYLMAQHLRDGRRSLAICSPTPQAGCSFVTANLAVALAQAGMKTLLIDANLRHPALDDYFIPRSPGPGLVQLLSDDSVSFNDVITTDVIPDLSFIPAGGSASNAQELLAGPMFKRMVDTCLRDFDLTIVDTPPSTTAADARRIASVMRYALVVARKDNSYVDDLRKLVDELKADRVKVIGSFLNDY
jgi:protein-tyrosine kinase